MQIDRPIYVEYDKVMTLDLAKMTTRVTDRTGLQLPTK